MSCIDAHLHAHPDAQRRLARRIVDADAHWNALDHLDPVAAGILGRQQRKANAASKQQAAQKTAQQQQQEEAQAKAAEQQNLDSFKRAFSACMDARGYSVK